MYNITLLQHYHTDTAHIPHSHSYTHSTQVKKERARQRRGTNMIIFLRQKGQREIKEMRAVGKEREGRERAVGGG